MPHVTAQTRRMLAQWQRCEHQPAGLLVFCAAFAVQPLQGFLNGVSAKGRVAPSYCGARSYNHPEGQGSKLKVNVPITFTGTPESVAGLNCHWRAALTAASFSSG